MVPSQLAVMFASLDTVFTRVEEYVSLARWLQLLAGLRMFSGGYYLHHMTHLVYLPPPRDFLLPPPPPLPPSPPSPPSPPPPLTAILLLLLPHPPPSPTRHLAVVMGYFNPRVIETKVYDSSRASPRAKGGQGTICR